MITWFISLVLGEIMKPFLSIKRTLRTKLSHLRFRPEVADSQYVHDGCSFINSSAMCISVLACCFSIMSNLTVYNFNYASNVCFLTDSSVTKKVIQMSCHLIINGIILPIWQLFDIADSHILMSRIVPNKIISLQIKPCTSYYPNQFPGNTKIYFHLSNLTFHLTQT